jgi:2-polyprenyl-6-methoxyphenol hydroxylase-like FAD-dependent oxidoreductase
MHEGVLIVGAGPVGLAAAIELARRDVPVRIIDKLPEPTWQSRALVVHARTLEAFARMGVADAIIAGGRRTSALELHARGRRVGRLELGRVKSPFPFSVTLAQDDTERILSERLATFGVQVERGLELCGCEQDEHAVTARLADGSTIDCAWLIGADGAHSTVRRAVGLELEGALTGGARFLLADVDADSPLPPEAMHFFYSPSTAPLLALPMLGRRVRLITQPEGDPPATLETMQAIVDARVKGVALDSPRWITYFQVRAAQVPHYRRGRVFLAGDAAHVHSPAGGQGMNLGIQDAFNLAWKLAVPAPTEALLDSYEAERRPVAAHVIRTTSVLTRSATLRRPALRRVRNTCLRVATSVRPVADLLAGELEETRVAYRRSPIVSGHGRRPRPGDHEPFPLTEQTEHATVALGGDRIALVRPDGYVGLVADRDDTAAVSRYFARLDARARSAAGR